MAGPQASVRVERRQRRESVQAGLRTAMLDLLREGSSFKALTVDDIAVAAGIKRSAFYFYFRDKEDLLEHAAEDVVALLYEQADRWWHGAGEPEARVRAALEGVTSVYARHADLLRVITEVSGYDDEVRDFWRTLIDRFVTATADHLRAEQTAGRAAGLDPDETAFQLVWMVERCCYVRMATGETPPEELARSLTRTWMALLYSQATLRT